MGAILGTIAGWERDFRWTPGYRIYIGPPYIKYDVPPERLEPWERWEYRVRLNVTVYLCDTPDLYYPIVIREITGILMVSIYEEEYPGGLDQWVSDISISEAEELLSRSNVEVAGLVPCEKSYDVETYDEQEIRPVGKPKPPKYILDQILYLEKKYEKAKTKGERISIRKGINKMKRRYGIPVEKRKVKKEKKEEEKK
jgi:hypothetical protein